MGKILVIKNADFSANAIDIIPPQELFDVSGVRRNYSVYSLNDSNPATVRSYNGFCVCGYITIPQGATRIKISGINHNGAVRFRFSKTNSDSEQVPQNTGLAGLYLQEVTETEAVINVPSDTTYKYFVASIFRDTSGTSAQQQAAANNADLTGVSIKVYFS